MTVIKYHDGGHARGDERYPTISRDLDLITEMVAGYVRKPAQ
ncbi:hypothetical protein HNQ59_000879 [Chitinivorax tropicus]|uniref:Uncharacterized protein n=1 Tax=Chitinivorax tropicus TaxID=714531 RepID=A0A840MGT6_9PROT|nr:hypothetical protein [Chitinivorax tropicus]